MSASSETAASLFFTSSLSRGKLETNSRISSVLKEASATSMRCWLARRTRSTAMATSTMLPAVRP